MTTTEALPEPVMYNTPWGNLVTLPRCTDYAARVIAAKDAEIERLRDALKGSLKEIEGEVIQYNLNAAQMPRLYTAMKIAREALKEPK